MHPVYWIGYSLSRLVATVAFEYAAEGRENLPETGGFLAALNHQSFLDPPLGGIASKRDLYFLARKTLLDVPVLGPILPRLNVIPVAKEGGDMAALKMVIREVKNGHGVLIFPEGTRSRNGRLQPAQAGIGLVIAKTLAPVVPMRIFGSFQAFSREAKRVTPRPVTVVVGSALHFTAADFAGETRVAYQAASERVMTAIAALRPSAKRMALHTDDPGLGPQRGSVKHS